MEDSNIFNYSHLKDEEDRYQPSSDRKKIAQDGLQTGYYELPSHATTISELVAEKKMLPRIGIIFRLCIDLHRFSKDTITKKLENMKNLIANYDNTSGQFEYDDIDIPSHASELRHIISHFSMSKSRGDIVKSCYRLNQKDGIDEQYDINKIKFFIEDLIEMHKRGEHL